jgi:hypothetical protein
VLWILGYADQGLQKANEAVALAEQVAHPFSIVWARSMVPTIHRLRGDVEAARRSLDVQLAICIEHGCQFYALLARIALGLIDVLRGKDEDFEAVRQSFSDLGSLGRRD